MLDKLHSNKPIQLLLGLLSGILFGFFLQRGGVTRYEILVGQLLLTDFTVVKVMMSAALTGMVGIYMMKWLGWAELSTKPGSIGTTVIGGLIFGIGFGILGYCPGTVTGAAAQGSLDALIGGIPGLILGSLLYAVMYPTLKKTMLDKGKFGNITIPELIPINRKATVAACGLLILVVLGLIEYLNL